MEQAIGNCVTPIHGLYILFYFHMLGAGDIKLTLYGTDDLQPRVPTAALNIGSCDSGYVSDWLYENYGIAVRSGAHCAPLMHEALGTREQGAVRFSFSHVLTEEEVRIAAQALREFAEEEMQQ